MSRTAAVLPYAALLVLSGALQRPLAGGLSVEGGLHDAVRQSNGPIALAGFALYAASLLALLPRLRALPLPATLLPMLGLNAWALLSALWSHDPATSLARAAGLTGTGITALVCLALVGPDRLLAVLVRFSAAFIAANAVLMLLAAGYTHHGVDDLYAMHAGLLRGTYGHKNEFAVYLALAVLAVAMFGHQVIRRRPVRFGLLAAGAAMLVASGSAKVLVAVPLAWAVAGVAGALAPGLRLSLVVTAAGATLVVSSIVPLDEVSRAGLEALGRDPTLSARTEIWEAALRCWQDDPLLGGGYAAAWNGGLGAAAAQAIGFDPGHPHNGYLAVLFDLGAVGLLLAGLNLAVLAWALLRASAVGDPAVYRMLVALWVAIVVLNLSGTHLAQPNDLVWACQIWMHALAARLTQSRSPNPLRTARPLTLAPGSQPLPAGVGA